MGKLKSIAFDIDGTLTDYGLYFETDFRRSYREKYGKEYKGKVDYTQVLYQNRFPDCDREFLDTWAEEAFMRSLQEGGKLFRPFAKELTKKLKSMGVKISIITARKGNQFVTDDEMEDLTRKQLELGEITYDDLYVVPSGDKVPVVKACGCQLIVEDNPDQALSLSDIIPVLLIDNRYNKKVQGKNIWRITSLHPDKFLKETGYALDHEERLDSYEGSTTQAKNVLIEENHIVYNAENLKNTNIIFVTSAKLKLNGHELLSEKITSKHRKGILIRLGLLNNPSDLTPKKEFEEGDRLVLSAIKRANIKHLDLTKTSSTDVYIVKCKIVESLLNYAESHKNNKFVFDGNEIMMLDRGKLDKYVKYPFFVCDVGEREKSVAMMGSNKKNYNQFLLMEDLTDTQTQLRKWRIIAGTAPKELSDYINRQYADSEGIDMVDFLPGEKPVNPDLLESVLSDNTFLITDLHLSTKDPEKTKRIIQAVNRRVTPKDHLLILGDLDGKKGTGSFKLTVDTIRKFNTKNIYLILGNNDPYKVSDYKKIGFKSVVTKAVYQPSPATKVILTHCPYPVNMDEVNIHGHIHGSHIYWNVDWRNHYDVWDEGFNPITIRECLDILERNEYKAKTEIHRNF